MNTNQTKEKLRDLINELVFTPHSENRDQELALEINSLSPDSKWSDYIFWSDEYFKDDETIDYDKFFKKIFNE